MRKLAELVGLCGICPIMRKVTNYAQNYARANRIIQRSLVSTTHARQRKHKRLCVIASFTVLMKTTQNSASVSTSVRLTVGLMACMTNSWK